jgi:hypothetical protein
MRSYRIGKIKHTFKVFYHIKLYKKKRNRLGFFLKYFYFRYKMFYRCLISIVFLVIFTNVIKYECVLEPAEGKNVLKRIFFSNYWNSKDYKQHLKFYRLQTIANKKENEKEKLRHNLLKEKEERKTKIFKEHLLPFVSGSFYKDFLTMRY